MTRKTAKTPALEQAVQDDIARFEAARTAGLEALHYAGKLASSAGEAVKAANEKRASALDASLAGLTAPGVMTMQFEFDVCDKAGNVTEHCRSSLRDYLAGFKNADASDNRSKQSAFRATVLPLFMGVPGDQSTGAKAAWALLTGKALPTAAALLDEGMHVAIDPDGAVKVEGGAGETADKLRNAALKSTSALVKAAKGETGTNRAAPQNDKAGDVREATPLELTRAVVALVKLVASGEGDLCNASLSNLREIARLVAGNPDAFTDDV